MTNDPILTALNARFFCLEELIKRGDTEASLKLITQCKSILPLPTEHNIDASLSRAGKLT